VLRARWGRACQSPPPHTPPLLPLPHRLLGQCPLYVNTSVVLAYEHTVCRGCLTRRIPALAILLVPQLVYCTPSCFSSPVTKPLPKTTQSNPSIRKLAAPSSVRRKRDSVREVRWGRAAAGGLGGAGGGWGGLGEGRHVGWYESDARGVHTRTTARTYPQSVLVRGIFVASHLYSTFRTDTAPRSQSIFQIAYGDR
jgi:hypothetical protein